MIVLALTNCPIALRGDLTRWLFEVDTNLYVGKLSGRVRENLWERVTESVSSGRAVMVYPTDNEQGFDFRVCGETWKPIDYNGLKLMLRPHPDSENGCTDETKLRPGFSNASRRLAARKFAGKKHSLYFPETYAIIDVETTGLTPEIDEIIEIGSIKVVGNERIESFSAVIRINRELSPQIVNLTGITNEELESEGRVLCEVMNEFYGFLGELPVVTHNAPFDLSFLRNAYEASGLPEFVNSSIDTLRLARKILYDAPDFKLETLMEHLGIDHANAHRAIGDCEATLLLYDKLRSINMSDND